MANNTVYPYGPGGQLPDGIGIINDLVNGGADQALAAEQGKALGEEIGKYYEGVHNQWLYPSYKDYIDENNKWKYDANYQMVFIKTVPGLHYKVTCGEKANYIAVLSASTLVNGGTPVWATGYTGRIRIEAGESFEFTAPSDGRFLYTVLSYSGNERDTVITEYRERNGSLIMGDVPLVPFLLEEGAIDYTDGTIFTASTCLHTDYLDLADVPRIKFSRCGGTVASSNGGIAFYSANKIYVCGQQMLLSQPDNHVYADEEIDVPAIARYARFTVWKDNTQNFYVTAGSADKNGSSIAHLASLASPFAGKKMVINGDSIAYGSGFDNRANAFSQIIGRMLGMRSINYAIGGSTAARKASDYDGVYLDYDEWQDAVEGGTLDTSKKYLVKDNINVPARPYHIYTYTGGAWTPGGDTSSDTGRTPLVDRIAEMDTDADVVLIHIASNDWAYTWTGFGDDSSRVPTDFFGALHLICQYLIDTYPDKLVLFLTPPFSWRYQPQGVGLATWNMTTWDAESPLGKTWWDYQEAMDTVLKEYGFPLLDLGRLMGFSQYDPWWALDTNGCHVHPKEECQPLIADIIARRLAEYMKQ